MTVGEKIQFYRKRSGLSQEELGQRLLVSRQTVSLWEMDKTMPTVDNLILLKDVFGVSVDDILSSTPPQSAAAGEPRESYLLQYDEEGLQATFKQWRSPLVNLFIKIIGISLLLLLVSLAADAPTVLIDLILGALVIATISLLAFLISSKKTFRATVQKALKNNYSYEIFEEHLTLQISCNGEIINTMKIHFSEIESMQSLEHHLLLRHAGQTHLFRKDALSPDSILFTLCEKFSSSPKRKPPSDTLRAASTWLFFLSIVSLLVPLPIIGALSGTDPAFVENMWMFFLFLPIPLASVVLGFYLKKKGYAYKKNVIVGFIIIPLLCLYGCFTFIFADTYSHDDTPILKAEAAISIDIPPHKAISTMQMSGTVPNESSFVSYITFEEDAVQEFESELSRSDKWMSYIPNDMYGIKPDFLLSEGDYYIIYNVTTGELNTIPTENGIYAFIAISYDMANNKMTLIEYKVEYVN